MTQSLPVSMIVDVDVNLTPAQAQFANLSTCLVLGTSAVIDVVTRMREYQGLSAVGVDFGTNSEEYDAAKRWFGQSPQPDNILIGRWAKAAAAGQLIGGAVSAANQLISAWTGIVAGSAKFTIDSGAATNLAGLDFHLCANLNAVA